MFEIEGFAELQRELEEASQAIQEVSGTLGTVSFNPHDPSSIEAAIAEVSRIIDARLGSYSGNSIIGPMIDDLKGKYREGILEKAAEARTNGSDD